jgi:hypothetical protein
MAQRNHRIRRFLFKLLLVSAVAWLIRLVRRSDDSWEYGGQWSSPAPEPVREPEVLHEEETVTGARVRARRQFPARRVAVAAAFTTLFFAGAAFTAGAGDQFARAFDPDQCQAAEDAQAAQAAAADPSSQQAQDESCSQPAEAAPAPADSSEAAPAESDESGDPSLGPADDSAPADPSGMPDESASPDQPAAADESAAPATSASDEAKPTAGKIDTRPALDRPIRARNTHQWVVKRARAVPRQDPEIEGPPSEATIWLNRALPDPTPPARRLSPRFAKYLVRISRQEKTSWALVLGMLRAEGENGRVPAKRGEVRTLAHRLHVEGAKRNPWGAVLAIAGRSGFADRTMALTRYNRAVGLKALVKGLEASKVRLTKKLLRDKRVSIYAGGRQDLRAGKVNVRVVALIEYLAEAHGQVTVSCLISGHRLYARPGVISAHIYGLAVDISGLGGLTIAGHQQPHSITERAVREILMLPVELMPRQVISLLGLGGPSFPLANHFDHIHVGY